MKPKRFRSWRSWLRYVCLAGLCVYTLLIGLGETYKGTDQAGQWLPMVAMGFLVPGDTPSDWVGHLAGTSINWTTTKAAYGSDVGKVTYSVTNAGELQTAIDAAVSGDKILLANGTYTGTIEIRCNGVLIVPTNTGSFGSRNVTFTGRLRFSGDNNVMGGFLCSYSGSNFPAWIIFEGGSDNRLTDFTATCVASGADEGQYLVGYRRSAFDNTVDHADLSCNGGFTLVQRIDYGDSIHGRGGDYDEINGPCTGNSASYCTLRDINTTGGTDSTHAMQVGHYPEQRVVTSQFTCEYCEFKNNNVTVAEFKTSGNILRYCYSHDNTRGGSFLLRAGTGNEVRGCYFKDNNSGVWVQDKNHVVVNNVFEGLTGNYVIRSSIGADPDRTTIGGVASIKRAFPWAEDCLIAHNTIINCAPSDVFDIAHNQYPCDSWPSDQCGDVPPSGLRVYNNSISCSNSGQRAIRQRDTIGNYASTVDSFYTGETENDYRNNHLHLTGGAVDGKAVDAGWSQTGEVTGDPSFTNTWTPQASSNVKDAGYVFNFSLGSTFNTVSETDYHGNNRTVNSTPDIGAVEEQTGTTTTYTAVDPTGWSILSVSDEETVSEDGAASNAIDGDNATIWHSQYNPSTVALPHTISINLNGRYTFDSFTYKARNDGSENGRIAAYEFFTSDNGTTWASQGTGTFSNTGNLQTHNFGSDKQANYIRLTASSEVNGKQFTTAAEIGLNGFRHGGNTNHRFFRA